MTLTEWQKDCWSLMEAKGFHAGRGQGRDDTLVRLCLIHSEVSEAVQVVKRKWGDSDDIDDFDRHGELRTELAREIADIVYRCLDLSGCLGVDLEDTLTQVHGANKLRPMNYGTPKAGG